MHNTDADRQWVYAALIAYAVGFIAFPPGVLLITDEFNYVTQAMAFARGALTIPGADPLYPPNPLRIASNYPPGTSFLQAPLVAAVGWQGAAALSVLSLIVATLATRKWLRDARRNGGFAILIPAYLGTLFFARVAMSDLPSAAVVAATLWMLWRAERGPGLHWSFLAGLSAGLSLLLRETNVVILAPFVLGALIRGQGSRVLILAGGLSGIGIRLWVSGELFGSALYLRDPGFGFSIRAALGNLPLVAVLLLAMFPLGAALPWLYRGERKAELSAAVAMYVALFLFYDYNAARESGLIRGLILTSRYFIPLLPVLAFMAAEVYPRIGQRGRWLGALRLPAEVLVVLLAFAIHPAVSRMEAEPRAIVAAIRDDTSQNVPIVTNHHATLKYLSPVYGERRLIFRSYVGEQDVRRFVSEYGQLSLVFLDRGDSEAFRRDAAANEQMLADLGRSCHLSARHDQRHDSGVRLRIVRVDRCN